MPTPDSANAMALGSALNPDHDFPELRDAAVLRILSTAEQSHPLDSAADKLGIGRSTFFNFLGIARKYSAARTIDKRPQKRSRH